jgi:hypothetical protein
MPFPRKRKGSEDVDDDVASRKRSKGGSEPTQEIDDDGNPYWMVSDDQRQRA